VTLRTRVCYNTKIRRWKKSAPCQNLCFFDFIFDPLFPGGQPDDLSFREILFLPENPKIAQALKKFLDEWEKSHPKAKPIPCKDKEAMSKTLEQLKSLGYIK
jgi:hypothetical protein